MASRIPTLVLTMVFLLAGQALSQQLSDIINLDNKVNINYEILGQQEIKIELSCAATSYCLIAFGEQLINVDVIKLERDGTNVYIKDMYSQYEDPTKLVNDPIQNLVVVSTSLSPNLTATFIRKLYTNDPRDHVIKLGELTPITWVVDGTSGTSEVMFFKLNFTCHYKCAKCFGPLASHCKSCRIAQEFVNKGYCDQSDNVKPLVKRSLFGDKFNFYWSYINYEYIEIMIEGDLVGYIGIGFENELGDTDIILVQIIPFYEQDDIVYNRIEVSDMYQTQQNVPEYDRALGGTDDLAVLGYHIDYNSNRFWVKLKRKLITNDLYDQTIEKKKARVIYSYSTDSYKLINYGNMKGIIVVDFSIESEINESERWNRIIQNAHMIFLFISWSFIADVSMFFVRYLKGYKKYLQIHVLIQVMINIISIIIALFMVKKNYQKIVDLSSQPFYVRVHFVVGIFILSIIFIQHLLGLIVKINIESEHGARTVLTIKQIHKVLGIFLYTLTKVNAYVGVYLYENLVIQRSYGEKYVYTYSMTIYYCFLIMFIFVFEFCYESQPGFFQKQVLLPNNILKSPKFGQYQEIIKRLNNLVPRYEIIQEFGDINFVVLNDQVYDVTDALHPGGVFIFNEIKGQEISRYFYGGQPVEQQSIGTHYHTIYAQNYLLNFYLGKIDREQHNPFKQVKQLQPSAMGKESQTIWELQQKRQTTPGFSVFKFRSEYYQIKNYIPGVEWFGRYFIIEPYGAGLFVPWRLYAQLICMSVENMQFRQNLLQWFTNKMSENEDNFGQNVQLIQKIKLNPTSSDLIIYVSKYPYAKGLSHFIHHHQHIPWQIKGPYGFGLELNAQSNGLHIIFAFGTGILQFLDLFDYLLKKSIYTVVYDNYGLDEANYMNPFNEDYKNTFGPDFRVLLFAGFREINMFYGFNMIQSLYLINQKYGLGIFDCAIKLGTPIENFPLPMIKAQTHFTENFVATHIEETKPEKVYIAGSPATRSEIRNFLINNKFPNSKICLV